jgi:hypothetical protein
MYEVLYLSLPDTYSRTYPTVQYISLTVQSINHACSNQPTGFCRQKSTGASQSSCRHTLTGAAQAIVDRHIQVQLNKCTHTGAAQAPVDSPVQVQDNTS